jgi:hypothetical protein
MRAALLAVVAALLGGCSGEVTTPPSQQPAGATTGMTLTIEYDARLVSISITGATYATSRKFGPFVVAASKLLPGETVGLTFDAADAGGTMVCAAGYDRDGTVDAEGCGNFAVRAHEVTTGTLTLN